MSPSPPGLRVPCGRGLARGGLSFPKPDLPSGRFSLTLVGVWPRTGPPTSPSRATQAPGTARGSSAPTVPDGPGRPAGVPPRPVPFGQGLSPPPTALAAPPKPAGAATPRTRLFPACLLPACPRTILQTNAGNGIRASAGPCQGGDASMGPGGPFLVAAAQPQESEGAGSSGVSGRGCSQGPPGSLCGFPPAGTPVQPPGPRGLGHTGDTPSAPDARLSHVCRTRGCTGNEPTPPTPAPTEPSAGPSLPGPIAGWEWTAQDDLRLMFPSGLGQPCSPAAPTHTVPPPP